MGRGRRARARAAVGERARRAGVAVNESVAPPARGDSAFLRQTRAPGGRAARRRPAPCVSRPLCGRALRVRHARLALARVVRPPFLGQLSGKWRGKGPGQARSRPVPGGSLPRPRLLLFVMFSFVVCCVQSRRCPEALGETRGELEPAGAARGLRGERATLQGDEGLPGDS